MHGLARAAKGEIKVNNIFEKARELGRLILESEESMRLADAQAALDNDSAAMAKMTEFSHYKAALQQAVESGHMDEASYDEAMVKLAIMRKDMLELTAAKDYLKAQEEFEALFVSVISILEGTVKSETGGKSCGCGGCGKHGKGKGCGLHC